MAIYRQFVPAEFPGYRSCLSLAIQSLCKDWADTNSRSRTIGEQVAHSDVGDWKTADSVALGTKILEPRTLYPGEYADAAAIAYRLKAIASKSAELIVNQPERSPILLNLPLSFS